LLVAVVSVADTGDVPWPLVSTTHLDDAAVEQPSPRGVELLRLEHLDGQRGFAVRQYEDATQPYLDGTWKAVAHLGFECLEGCVRRAIAHGQMRR
jgi:hypothetical protein